MPHSKRSDITPKLHAVTPSGGNMDFAGLVAAIRGIHESCSAQAIRAVHVSLTLRNWAIGAYIHHYELHGQDRANYGDRLFVMLADRLQALNIPNCSKSRLYRYRDFFKLYPQIVATLSPQFHDLFTAGAIETITPKVATPTPLSGEVLLDRLSYSHIELLIEVEDPLKRAFYEIECIRGNWSVRALKRQIATLYFERSGLSRDKEKLAAMVQQGVEIAAPKLAIRDPYIFEFLGLRAKDAVTETDLEAALVENLRDFLLEMGHGFCLEAQQKSIVIGHTRGFVDLVFYHRILKCHVLVELKVDEFRHEHIGQLNTYVTWYRKHMMAEGDNPPVGLLLCTGKDHALVEYALAAVDNRMFVSRYQLELPSKEELTRFIEEKRREVGENP
ncbi:MAG: PDDEXK nuclease domain-containing protein [Syntrophorhabdales bacterium]